MNRPVFVFLLCANMASANVFAQDCTKIQNASAQDITRGESVALLNRMVAACESQRPEDFFRLQTRRAQSLVTRVADKESLFKNYCEFTRNATHALGGNTKVGTHSIGPYKGRTKCGQAASYWFIHTEEGALVLRLEVAIEAGQLKIDTH